MPLTSLRDKLVALYPRAILAVACVWFAQIYCTQRHPYIDLHRYALGQERMPFQGRDLMRWPLLAASRSGLLQRATAGRPVLHSPEFLTMEVIAAVSLLLAGWAAVKLHRLAALDGPLPELAFAVLIIVCWFDFISTVPYSFPYDLPAVAFIGWGCYFILSGRFWALLPVFVFGTWNRETTLFLIGVLLFSAAGRSGEVRWRNLKGRDWCQAALLLTIWVAIVAAQKHAYAHNPSEAGPRIAGNLHSMANPLLWPNILSASAFLLPYVFLNRRRIAFAPLRGSLLLLPFWVLLLLSVGQILELRIYGDISVPVAVAATLILLADVQKTPRPGDLANSEI